MKEIRIVPTPLNGIITVPPSKSLSHRAIIAASMAEGTSTINNISQSEDILATIEAVQALGAKVELKDKKAIVKGRILSEKPKNCIDCKESGSTLRFMMPLGLLSGDEICFTGRGGLKNRPLAPFIDIFDKQGIFYSSTTLPMKIKGTLKPDDFKLRGDISSQFFTGLMFALPVLDGDSNLYITTPLESRSYIDLTIDTLKEFGVEVLYNEDSHLSIKGNQKYKPIDYTVEGDYSQAAFWIAAGLLGKRVQCSNLNPHSRQGDKAFIDIMEKSGAQINIAASSVTAIKSRLKAFNADVSQCPDIAPILAVMAAVSEGISYITGASRLRMKESDRLKAISTELNKLGAEIIEKEDHLIIKGKESLKGGAAESWGDHRIAMALSIASIKCTSPVTIINSDAVNKSYPEFYDDFIELGGIVNERNLG
ncbi:MAG: aroA [Clostridia bacterium]|jgi:3-phosphoshikimate 1-carboxyvinyltransferase|nr:aroA [Clostridia bacterium]